MVKYYTNIVRDDGFGAQYQNIICAIIYAEMNGGEFVYTKCNFDTVYLNNKEYDSLEDIMNIYPYYKSIDFIKEEGLAAIPLTIEQCYNFFEENMAQCLSSKSLDKIKEVFKQNKNLEVFDRNYRNVVIHIRRCSLNSNIDIPEHHDGIKVKELSVDELASTTVRFTSDEYYLSVINHFRNDGIPCKFHILSEGKKEDFSKYTGDDIVFHLNESLWDSYIYMVMADILVLSKSSFSYAAALLNENIVVYKPFWHMPAPHWLIMA